MESYITMHKEIKRIVLQSVSGINSIKSDDMDALYAETFHALKQITGQFGTLEYQFNLSMEIFIENTFVEISSVLKQIVENNLASLQDDPTVSDAVFAAYFALSLIYKKTENIEGLKSLTEEKYDTAFRNGFIEYPLLFEVFSRYYKRTKTVEGYRKALENDKQAIRKLSRRKVSNIATCISFASTVCLILEANGDLFDLQDINTAIEYVNNAIGINPEYPKYYYLKAKLTFYSNMPAENLEDFDALCQRVIRNLEDAEDFLTEKGVYRAAERNEYDSFKNKIWVMLDMRKHPRFLMKDDELSLIKSKITECADIDRCTCLPPLPELRQGDKYFFICYSSKDFKSVYSDIIELYKNKIPYRYDQNIASGATWQQIVRSYISSKDCVGAVFYISKNTMQTNSVCEEIEIVKEFAKPYFCVNLEGSRYPSDILTDIIIENHINGNNRLTGKQMRVFLNAFDDDTVFTPKFRENQDTGVQHFQKYLFDIRNCFPDLAICE